MATVASRGSSVVATTGSTWASATSAQLCDGAVGTNPATYATFTNATSGGAGTVTIGGYFGAGSLDAGAQAITAISAVVRNFVAATNRWSSITAQLQDSTGTNIGAAQTVAVNGSATSVTVTPNVLPTIAQVNAGLRMQITATHTTTTSSVFSLDYVDITVTYSLLSPTGATLTITGGTPSIVIIAPKVETLVESFATQDTTKWTGWNASIAATGGQLQVTPPSGTRETLTTASRYDLTGSAVFVEVVNWPADFSTATNSWMMLTCESQTSNLYYEALYVGRNSTSQTVPTLFFEETVNGVSNATTLTWDPVAHRFIRIRESGGSIYWDTSPDRITWTNQRNKVKDASVDITHVTVYLDVFCSNTTPGTAVFDNVNTVSVLPTGATLTITGGTPIVTTSTVVRPTGATLAITGGTPIVTALQNVVVRPTGAALSITAGTPTVAVSQNVVVQPAGATLTVTPGTPTVSTPVLVQPAGATLTVTAGTPVVSAPVLVQPAGAALSLTAGTPIVSTPIAATPNGATLSITTGTPVVTVTGTGNLEIAPNGASLTITLGTPLVVQATAVTPSGATLTINPGTPQVLVPLIAQPTAAALTITTGVPVIWAGLRPIGAALSMAGGTPLVHAAYTVKPAGATLSVTAGAPLVRVSAGAGSALTHGGKLLVLGGHIVLLPA